MQQAGQGMQADCLGNGGRPARSGVPVGGHHIAVELHRSLHPGLAQGLQDDGLLS